MNLHDTQQNLLKLQLKNERQKKKIEDLQEEGNEQQQQIERETALLQANTQTPVMQPPNARTTGSLTKTEVAKYSTEEQVKLLEEQEEEIERYKQLERRVEEANAILTVIQGQMPKLQSTLTNFEGMTMY